MTVSRTHKRRIMIQAFVRFTFRRLRVRQTASIDHNNAAEETR